jgi:hypothetical protein
MHIHSFHKSKTVDMKVVILSINVFVHPGALLLKQKRIGHFTDILYCWEKRFLFIIFFCSVLFWKNSVE